MIINTRARTDTVQYFTKWLLNRFKEGIVMSRNPLFPNNVTVYELSPEKVDCVVFCSKNYEPILSHIKKITDRFNTYFHYTITAYGKDVEPGVPGIDESIDTLKRLSAAVGKERIAWRYDPVLLTEKYTVSRRIETFEYMASRITPYVDRCIFSFVEMYKKLEYNMPEIIPLTPEYKTELAEAMGNIAKNHGLYLQTCATEQDFSKYGIHESGCMTLDIIGRANGVKFRDIKHTGSRIGCKCVETRGIGDYDTCLNGCKYCYANKNPKRAFDNFKYHDPDSSLLLGHIKDTDIVKKAVQRSFIKESGSEQLSFEF